MVRFLLIVNTLLMSAYCWLLVAASNRLYIDWGMIFMLPGVLLVPFVPNNNGLEGLGTIFIGGFVISGIIIACIQSWLIHLLFRSEKYQRFGKLGIFVSGILLSLTILAVVIAYSVTGTLLY